VTIELAAAATLADDEAIAIGLVCENGNSSWSNEENNYVCRAMEYVCVINYYV